MRETFDDVLRAGSSRTDFQPAPRRKVGPTAQHYVSFERRYAACFYPAAPINVSHARAWNGGQNFGCR